MNTHLPSMSLTGFQSTLRRTERHVLNYAREKGMTISIHAPTNGATTIHLQRFTRFKYFNPRSDERSDMKLSHKQRLYHYFNPRSDERSDCNFAQKNEKTIQNRLIILLFSTNSLRLLCSCIQYSFFLFIFHGANDLVILCSLSFRTTSKN